jgi:Chaperone of endosialidase
MRYLIFTLTFTLMALLAKAQVAINITGAPPAASTMLDVNSSSKGVLFPQVSIDSLKDVTSIPSPANGLVVYNTTQPGVRNDMARGYYWYSTNALSWVKLADNLTDNKWKDGGLLGIQLRDTLDGVEIMDGYTGTSFNYNPKVKILKKIDSALLNAKNNITALVLTGVNRKTTAGWESRQKTSIIFENNYLTTSGASGTANNVAISSYIENTGTTQNTQTNGLAFYVTAPPQNTATADTPSLAMFRHNVGVGAYPTDINNVTEGRVQITGFSNGDQLSLRHPSSINLKWGLYVSAIDSSLNFYSNGSLRANIDRVTGVYSALSDRTRKKNIIPMESVLESVLQLPAYSYNYLDSKDTDRKMLGFMAQDIQPFFPELVYQRYDRDITKPVLTMDYSGLGVIAIKAIQEQQKQIDVVKSENDYLKEKIEELIKRVEILEKK